MGKQSHLSESSLKHFFKIDKGIPIPPPRRGGKLKSDKLHFFLPFRYMEVGDSFLLPVETPARRQARYNQAMSAIGKIKMEMPFTRWSIRYIVNGYKAGVRIWRVK